MGEKGRGRGRGGGRQNTWALPEAFCSLFGGTNNPNPGGGSSGGRIALTVGFFVGVAWRGRWEVVVGLGSDSPSKQCTPTTLVVEVCVIGEKFGWRGKGGRAPEEPFTQPQNTFPLLRTASTVSSSRL